MEISDPHSTIEKLMSSMLDGARRQASASPHTDFNTPPPAEAFIAAHGEPPTAPAADLPSLTVTEAALLNLQADFEPRGDDQYHLHDLVKYHDRNFVQNAYLAILKRGPDATGYKAFIESLRSGRLNKIDVLARLRYSTEGRAKKVRVQGLFVPAAVRQLYRLPLVGYLLRCGVGVARLPTLIRHQQQFEAHVHAQQQQIVEHANHLATLLNQQQREVSHVLMQAAEASRADTDRRQQQLELLRQEQQAQLNLLRQEQQAQLNWLKQEQLGLVDLQQALREALLERLDATQQQFDVLLDKAVAHWQREMQALEARHYEQGAEWQAQVQASTRGMEIEVEALGRDLRAEVERIVGQERELRTELTLQGQRVARLLAEATKPVPASSEGRPVTVFADEQQHLDDAFYLSFEERFRGHPAEIRERLKIYLPLVEEARAANSSHPLLDIGCGRGEWLELLRESKVSARGVDTNRALVADGQGRGLSIIEADLLAHLRELPDNSLAALTGFHIIEHLPLETLLRLLDETVRVVRPGGLVVFETPNPENVLVGSCNFYFDPTHRNPLPPPVMKFMLESRGLSRVRIIRLNPSDAEPVAGDTDLVKRFNQLFYGPMDYAVVGWKV